MEKNQETLKEIEKKRKELGLSQVELAKRIGFSRGYYNMLIHGKKPVSDKLADQLQNVLQEYRKEKESGYRMQTEDLEEGFKSADDVWNIKEAGEMTDEYIEENEDSIAFDPVEWITNLEARRKSYGVSQNEYVETAGITFLFVVLLAIIFTAFFATSPISMTTWTLGNKASSFSRKGRLSSIMLLSTEV